MTTYEVWVNGKRMLETSDLDVAKEATRAWAERQHNVHLYQINTREIRV